MTNISLLKGHKYNKLIGLLSMGSGRIIQAILSFVTVSILARILGPEELGVYSLLLAVFAYGVHVSEFGLRSVIMREWNIPNEKECKTLSLYFIVRLFAATVVSITVYFGAFVFYPQYAFFLALILLSTFFISLQIDWFLLVSERYLAASWVLVIRPAFYLLTVCLLFLVDKINLTTLALAFLFSWSALAISTWLIAGRYLLKFSTTKLSFKKTWYLLGEGWPILFIALIGQAVHNADLLWVGSQYGAENAGYYFLASSIVVAGMVFSNAMSQMALGRMSKYLDDKSKFSSQMRDDLKIIIRIGLVGSIGLIFIASPLITFFFGDEYKTSSELIIYFIPYFFLSHITGLLYSCVIVIGEQKNLLYINIFRVLMLFSSLFVLSIYSHNIGLIAVVKAVVEFFVIIIIVRYISKGYFDKLFTKCFF